MAGWPTWVILSLAILPLSTASPVSTIPPPAAQEHETDNPHTRKLLGSSVVTSVSVIMDHGNGTKTYITDGNSHSGDSTSGQLGKPPQVVGTPGTLLSPDRYEFYTFGKEGELVKKLMTLDQIQSLIAAAGGEEDDDLSDQPVYYHQPLVEAGDTEGVNKVLESVHNVLKGELEAAAAAGQHSGEVPLLPDQSWTILLPGLLNNDMDFKETFSTASKKPIPNKPSSTPATTPLATTRFPPRKTTTTTPEPSIQQHYKPLATSYVKPAQTTPPNKFTTSKVPLHQPSHHQQQLASSSILSPQYTSIKAPPSKPTPSSTSSTSTTVKYSAHYTTPHPTIPPQHTTHYVKPQYAGAVTKPGAISVKKPISSTHSPIKSTTPTTTIQTTASLETITQSTGITTDSSSINTTPKPIITKKTTTAPPITTYKASTTSPLTINTGIKQPIINNVSHKTTTQYPYKPTTYRPSTAHPQPVKYTQNQKPSGIPTIVHYLPMHSMSPSHAPVFPTKAPHESINQTQKLTTQQQSVKPITTSPTTTTNDNSVISTILEEFSTTVPSTDKEFQEITIQRLPSTATIATKNHYTVINAIKSSPTTTTKPEKSTQTITPNYETTIQNSETDASAAPLVAVHTAESIQTIADEDSSNTVSVVTIFEDTTRPMEIVTTAGKTWPTTNIGTADKLIQSTTAADQLESFTTIASTTSTTTSKPSTRPSSTTSKPSTRPSTTTSKPSTRPSTIMVQISAKPPYRNNSSSSASDNHFRPISTRPAVVHRRTTTTTAPPPRRGSVSYTPLPQVYKSTPSSLRQPIQTTVAPNIYTKTTSRPSVATVEQHRPIITTTASTSKKPTIPSTTAAATTTITTTESTTITPPSETTTYLNKISLEQLPLKLIENLKDTNKQTIYEMPSTVDIDNYSTVQKVDSSTMSSTESSSAETTYITAATLTTFPAKIVIVNNSEPFIVNHSLSEQNVSRLPVSEALTLTQTTSFTTLPSTVEYSTIDSETTTIEPITTYKDQILEEGINAVTSILLDGEQKKEFLLNMTRPLGVFNNTFITTTEDDQYITNITEEITTTTELVPLSEEKSETRLDEVELTENYEEIIETINDMSTTQQGEINNVDKDLLKISTQQPVHNQVKKHIPNEIKNAISEETKTEDKKSNKTSENSTINPNEQEINKNQYKEKPNETQNINKSKMNNTELSEKLASSEESKKTVHTKPISQEIMKKPTQQEIKKQPTEDLKRPTLTKTKPTNQKPVQEKVNNSTKESVKETTKDEGDDTKIPVKLEIKNQTGDDTKKPNIVPTKESKLNPDIVDEPNQMVEILQQDPTSTITAATLNTATTFTTSERPIVHEQIKLQEVDKNVNVFNKFNSKRPVYQPPPQELSAPPAAIDLHPAPYESMGLEASTAFLAEDIRRFADLCNELAFKLWSALTSKGQISSRSLVMSPFAVTSLLAMVFLGARGATSGQMNDILRLDDMVTFNPHQVFQNVTESVLNSKTKGVATAAFVRQLYSDKSKGKLLDFYKERAQQYYQGHVEEINFSTVGDIIRRRTNLLIKRQTLGKVSEYLRGSSLNMKPPLAAFSANIFQTDCELGSTEGRDGEMYFVVRPSTRQRRLVPVPAVVWRQGFLAGYEPSLDATSVCLGPDSVVSTILILPGQQGQVAPGDGLARLEQRLIETNYRRGAWSRLLRSQLSRPGLELQVPRFSHRSVLNVTGALTRMGLRDLFGTKADLRGLNGLSNDLHLSDMVQVNTFSTCGEETVGARHHIETYPASPQRTGRDEPDSQASSVADMLHDYSHNMQQWQQQWDSIPLALRPRQARLPDNPRLRFDRPFLYVVRHNPSGIILHMGRFNPRLLP